MGKWEEYEYTGQFSIKSGDVIYRPMLAVAVSANSNSDVCFSMIDSGTDDTLIDAGFAKILGIDEAKCEKIKVGGIVGQTSNAFKAVVKLKIEKFDEEFETEVIFVPGMFVAGLLGQKDIFENFKIRFEKKDKKFYLQREK
ncbi:retroviral-like aspartic protease [Candidatus Nomurabacteria bacterium]|nr:retroviral-like aspartic protease [Candidatus Nomurabacteria bacterium]